MTRLHPFAPTEAITTVEVTPLLERGPSTLSYRVEGAVRMPDPAAPERTDGLWQRTCFELFVRPAGGEAYFEFNFSPSTQWAAYRFDSYRAGMAPLDLAPPLVTRRPDGVDVAIDLSALPGGDWQVGLTAVIEAIDGAKSYWALAHPGPQPDFHAAAGFALAVPAG